MNFSVGHEGDVVVFGMEGELTVANRQELKQAVLDAVANGDQKVLIDFSGTSYIDSSGLGALVSLSKRIREAGGELRLAALNDDLGTLFELTRLNTLFHIAESRSAGLADLAKT
jgi:anti-sigma B factor antagonist